MNAVAFTTIFSSDSYIEANLYANRLKSEGINAFLKDEFTVTIDPILSNAVGGIKVVVPEGEADAAGFLIRSWKEEAAHAALCPVCGKGELLLVSSGKRPLNFLAGIFGTLLGNYALSVEKKYTCFVCGSEFDELPEP